MLDAQLGRYRRRLATNWNELTGAQLLAVVAVRQRPFAQPTQLADALLEILLDLPAPAFARLNVVQRVELRPLTRFLATTAPPLTAQLLPCLTLPFLRFIEQPRHFYGPREAFRNLRFDEFIFADTFYLRYLQTKQDKWLDQLVATLYRPERRPYRPKAVNYAGDRREDFNEHLLPARAEQLAKLPAHLKQAVLLYYQGCRRLLEQRYEYVFTADTSQKATTSGWQDVLHELAGGVPQLDATAQQGLANVLREMNRVLRRHEERQSQLESQRY
jgi:hypothetical protein